MTLTKHVIVPAMGYFSDYLNKTSVKKIFNSPRRADINLSTLRIFTAILKQPALHCIEYRK